MSTSTILFLGAAGCGVLFAVCVVFARGAPLPEVRWAGSWRWW